MILSSKSFSLNCKFAASIIRIKFIYLTSFILGVISFYGYLFAFLNGLIWITESCLIAVTMGEHITKLKHRFEKLSLYHIKRLKCEESNGIKRTNSKLLDIQNLFISIPQETGEPIVLQRELNLCARRGQCVLVTGITGCGKTSLFRICAGLWPIEATLVQLPARNYMIFIPQRPYVPIGSLRFQALFLLNKRCPSYIKNLSQTAIKELFKLVNMDYLLERYNIDIVCIIMWRIITGPSK